MLKEVLKDLRDGKELVLEWYENAFGAAPLTALRFDGGAWEVKELNCNSSYWLGLGTCACNSHPTYNIEEIERREALKLIKKYVEKIQEKEKQKEKEIEFLDTLINSL